MTGFLDSFSGSLAYLKKIGGNFSAKIWTYSWKYG